MQTLRMTEQPGTAKRGGHGPQPTGPLTPRARFKKIADDRLPKALKAIDHLKQFGNPAVYSFYPSESQQMIDALMQKVEELRFVLQNPGKAPPVLKFEDERD